MDLRMLFYRNQEPGNFIILSLCEGMGASQGFWPLVKKVKKLATPSMKVPAAPKAHDGQAIKFFAIGQQICQLYDSMCSIFTN